MRGAAGTGTRKPEARTRKADGSLGWDDYAPFYDWENARTHGRRDVAFWRSLALRSRGRVLELGCGTGRLLTPLARAGARITGIDRSLPMLAHAIERSRRLPKRRRPRIVRGDIRALPFARASFDLVMAPYGMLQSLVRDRDLAAALADCARVLKRGGTLGIDLVPDLPAWDEYRRDVRLRGRAKGGGRITLVESVRQDRRRGVTIFDEEFVLTRGRRARRHRFSLTFRTLSVPDTIERLAAAGLTAERILGDYRGAAWDDRADVWVILARKA